MKEAFARGEDIHRDTASRVFGVPPEEVTPGQRSKCKMVNFGIIYGISAFGLAQRLKITRGEAAEFDTSVPHAMTAVGSRPAEVLSIFDETGARMQTHTAEA
jgi:hypothetical protein